MTFEQTMKQLRGAGAAGQTAAEEIAKALVMVAGTIVNRLSDYLPVATVPTHRIVARDCNGNISSNQFIPNYNHLKINFIRSKVSHTAGVNHAGVMDNPGGGGNYAINNLLMGINNNNLN